MKRLTLLLPILLLTGCTREHAPQAHRHDPSAHRSPYAGEEARSIKALSEEDIAGYRDGRGMGFARAAELNRYPGPMHVLEHAETLGLSPEQREETQAIFERMREEAIRLGERIVEAEAALDRLFADEQARAESVAAQAGRIGELQGRLRAVHLNAHVEMRRVLTPEQVRRYVEVRGYEGSHSSTR